MSRFIVLITDLKEQWWFDLDADSLPSAKEKAETRLREMSLWPVLNAEVVEPFARERLEKKEDTSPVPVEDSEASFVLVADGSCIQNPGPGGWAAILIRNGRESMRSGGEDQTTNNRMELTAVLQGLFMLPGPSKVRIIIDSRYVLDGFDKGWLEIWKKNGWKTAGKTPVKNQDLWELLDREIKKHEITWQWVKGHSGHPLNSKVDAEANRQANQRL